MAEQKRITRRAVRAMLRPKPGRVRGRDPFKPKVLYPDFIVHDTTYVHGPDGELIEVEVV
jgi:hypothetical protein